MNNVIRFVDGIIRSVDSNVPGGWTTIALVILVTSVITLFWKVLTVKVPKGKVAVIVDRCGKAIGYLPAGSHSRNHFGRRRYRLVDITYTFDGQVQCPNFRGNHPLRMTFDYELYVNDILRADAMLHMHTIGAELGLRVQSTFGALLYHGKITDDSKCVEIALLVQQVLQKYFYGRMTIGTIEVTSAHRRPVQDFS